MREFGLVIEMLETYISSLHSISSLSCLFVRSVSSVSLLCFHTAQSAGGTFSVIVLGRSAGRRDLVNLFLGCLTQGPAYFPVVATTHRGFTVLPLLCDHHQLPPVLSVHDCDALSCSESLAPVVIPSCVSLEFVPVLSINGSVNCGFDLAGVLLEMAFIVCDSSRLGVPVNGSVNCGSGSLLFELASSVLCYWVRACLPWSASVPASVPCFFSFCLINSCCFDLLLPMLCLPTVSACVLLPISPVCCVSLWETPTVSVLYPPLVVVVYPTVFASSSLFVIVSTHPLTLLALALSVLDLDYVSHLVSELCRVYFQSEILGFVCHLAVCFVVECCWIRVVLAPILLGSSVPANFSAPLFFCLASMYSR